MFVLIRIVLVREYVLTGRQSVPPTGRSFNADDVPPETGGSPFPAGERHPDCLLYRMKTGQLDFAAVFSMEPEGVLE
jgi:hypothetical protein